MFQVNVIYSTFSAVIVFVRQSLSAVCVFVKCKGMRQIDCSPVNERSSLDPLQLKVKFKPEARPIFCRPRLLPLAILVNLNDAYEDRIRKGVWKHSETPRSSNNFIKILSLRCN